MSECRHNLAERETACFDGVCPTCLLESNAKLRMWITDLQSGMYVNCVYCGHRYGPVDTTPVAMADVLRQHVEHCPAHPMNALRVERDALAERAEGLRLALVKCRGHTSYLSGANGELLTGLLATIERICDAALAAPRSP